jgi:hypothetical protein
MSTVDKNAITLQGIIDEIERVGRLIGINFDSVVKLIYTTVRDASANTDADYTELFSLLRDIFNAFKRILASEIGPDGLFGSPTDPAKVLSKHRDVLSRLDRLSSQGDVGGVISLERSFQATFFDDIDLCYRQLCAMRSAADGSKDGRIEEQLATIATDVNGKLDRFVQSDRELFKGAMERSALLEGALEKYTNAHRDLIDGYRVLKQEVSGFDHKAVGKVVNDLGGMISPIHQAVQESVTSLADVVKDSKRRIDIASSLRDVTSRALNDFRAGCDLKDSERDARVENYRDGVLSLAFTGYTYALPVITRFSGERQRINAEYAKVEKDLANWNNPVRAERAKLRKVELTEELAAIDRTINHNTEISQRLFHIINECGGEERAKAITNGVNGRVLSLEAPPTRIPNIPPSYVSVRPEGLTNSITIEVVPSEQSEQDLAELREELLAGDVQEYSDDEDPVDLVGDFNLINNWSMGPSTAGRWEA